MLTQPQTAHHCVHTAPALSTQPTPSQSKPKPDPSPPRHRLGPDFYVHGTEHAAVLERMRANMRKQGVVRNMVGFYNMNVLSRWQLAKVGG